MGSGYLDRRGNDVVTLPDKAPISRLRISLAFVLTPILISLAVAFAMPAYDGLPNYVDRVLRTWPIYFVFGAVPPTFLFGLPAFMVLRKLARLTALTCALVGAVIATVPWFLLGLSPTGSAWTDGRATIIDGRYTLYGWLEFGQFLLIIAACGAVGGVIFWAIAAARPPKRRAA